MTLFCTMGDNPYNYCNLQWEIIHTLLSCDNIFFVHVLYVFSLVLVCLLMIVQCLDFKSIKLLLLLLLLLCIIFFILKRSERLIHRLNIDLVWIMVFNAIFNYISVISWHDGQFYWWRKPELHDKTTELS